MRSNALIIVALLGVVTWPARPASAQQMPPLEQRAVGCYVIDVGEWDPARHESERSAQTPPRRIELRAERGTDSFEDGRLLLRPVIGESVNPKAHLAGRRVACRGDGAEGERNPPQGGGIR